MRSAARFYAVQALFQMEAADAALRPWSRSSRRIASAPRSTARPMPSPTSRISAPWSTAAVDRAGPRSTSSPHQALVARWPIDRIDPTLRALFRAAGAELVATDTPPKVTINEYRRRRESLLPGRQGGQVRQRRARPHGPRRAAAGVRLSSARGPVVAEGVTEHRLRYGAHRPTCRPGRPRPRNPRRSASAACPRPPGLP